MGANQQVITQNVFSQRNNVGLIRELVTRIIKLNAIKKNIDVAITSEKSKKKIIITEIIERKIFKLGQFFKQQRQKQKSDCNNTETTQLEQLLEIERLQKMGADIRCSNDTSRQKTYTIVFYE